MKIGKLGAAGLVVAGAAWAGCTTPGPTTLDITGTTSTTDASSTTGNPGSGGASASSTGAGASPGAAKAYFISTVYPALAVVPINAGDATTCALCHAPPGTGPQYLSTDAESSYASITAYPNFISIPANSKLVVYGGAAHTGPGMNANQLADVTTWLNMEVAERMLAGGTTTTTAATGAGGGAATTSATTTTTTGAGGGSTTGLTLTEALTQYGQCMSYTEWQSPRGSTYSLVDLPSTTTTSGPCQGCHEAGLYGNWLSSNPAETFAKNQMMPFVTRQVSGENNPDGSFKRLIPARRWILKGSETCSPGQTICHPQYSLSSQAQLAIDNFVADTIAKFEAGNCMPDGAGGGGGSGGGP